MCKINEKIKTKMIENLYKKISKYSTKQNENWEIISLTCATIWIEPSLNLAKLSKLINVQKNIVKRKMNIKSNGDANFPRIPRFSWWAYLLQGCPFFKETRALSSSCWEESPQWVWLKMLRIFFSKTMYPAEFSVDWISIDLFRNF